MLISFYFYLNLYNNFRFIRIKQLFYYMGNTVCPSNKDQNNDVNLETNK